MNRDRMQDKFRHVKPNFYVIIGDKVVILWARKKSGYELSLVSAILTPLGPYKFKTHVPTEHTGRYLFRRLNKRVYLDDIKTFTNEFWNNENGSISYRNFKEVYPYIKFNEII